MQLVAPHMWGNPAGRVARPPALNCPWRELGVEEVESTRAREQGLGLGGAPAG